MLKLSVCLWAFFLVGCVWVTGCFAATQQPDILYMNRCASGCTVLPGGDDAVAGKSSIVQGTSTLAPFPGTDATFDQAAACVRNVFLPFNIHVVACSPGAAPRREIMLTTIASQIGLPNGLDAVSFYDGNPHDNVIGFVFATTIGSTAVDKLCQITAQTVAFVYGLEYVVNNCPDLEANATGCGEKSFTNVDSTCAGFFSGTPGACKLGNTTQNSYAQILSVAGASDFILANSFEGFEVMHAGPSP